MKPILRRKWRLLLIALSPALLIGLTLGCIRLATAALEMRYPAPGKMVQVERGTLHLYCAGHGNPTIIIEPGMGVDWVGWRLVWSSLVQITEVCVYDRAGYGWSPPGPMPRSAAQLAEELHTLLINAGKTRPAILVAHSFGGYIARIYVNHFPASVAGAVLVDPSQEDEDARQPNHDRSGWIPALGTGHLRLLCEGLSTLPLDLRQAPRSFQHRYLMSSSVDQARAGRSEYLALPISEAQVRSSPFPRELPLTVITAMHAGFPAMHRKLQQKLAKSSDFGRQIDAAQSGHAIQLDQPELIVAAVLDLVARLRAKNGEYSAYEESFW
jgi:pimeloyl-ACP methyl ester carboxylesterase